MADNPLSSYFRRPSIYIRLPSNGKFYPTGALRLTESGEYPVFPMTAIDEITYRTPDALFNGQGIIDVIQSCVPHIKNAWAIPTIDLDAILVGIRMASYGSSLDIDTKCPSCNEESTFSISLQSILDNLKSPDFDQTMTIGDLEVGFKPLNFRQTNENNIIRFEEQKLLNVLSDTNMEEAQKLKLLNEAFKKVSSLTVKAVAQGIAYIKTPDSAVTEQTFIEEYLKNCDNKVFTRIRDRVVELKAESELKPLDITCPECNYQYKQSFTLDMANFFE